MSLEMDPDLALVRKLHLELNGSGRRTRGVAQPPSKKLKREPAATFSTGQRETSSMSQSGSDSRDIGKQGRRDGTLKRLRKKQPDSDSNQNQAQEDEITTVQNVQKDALEPQVSTKIATDSKVGRVGDGDVGSRNTYNLAEIGSSGLEMGQEHAVSLAQSLAAAKLAKFGPRVKCFYQGSPYGVSIDAAACLTKQTLETALREALADELNVSNSLDVDIFVYSEEGKQSLCKADETEEEWKRVLKGAKRIYFSRRPAISAS